MANFLTYYKKHNRNIYSLLVSILLALWYNGIAGLLNYYWPERGPALSIIFMSLPLLIFLTDDGHLDELYNPPSSSTIANITATNQDQAEIRRNGFTVLK